MKFFSTQDKEFIDNLMPRAGEPVHSDLWSQIYNYLKDNHPELSYSEKSSYLSELLTYKESIL